MQNFSHFSKPTHPTHKVWKKIKITWSENHFSENKYFGKKKFFPLKKALWISEIFLVSDPPPLWKIKLLLNEYLGDLCILRAYFFYPRSSGRNDYFFLPTWRGGLPRPRVGKFLFPLVFRNEVNICPHNSIQNEIHLFLF